MSLSMVLIRTLFLRLVPFTKLEEGFTELPTDRGVFDQLPRKGCVLPCLKNLVSFLGTQLSVHLITRNYCRKNFGDFFGLVRKNLLTDVPKKVRINCLLKIGGSSVDISEILFVIQLLERIYESFHTGFFIKNSESAARRKFFCRPCAVDSFGCRSYWGRGRRGGSI